MANTLGNFANVWDVANSKYNVACLYEEQGLLKLDQARQLFLECEQIYSKVYGAQHEGTVDAGRRAATVVRTQEGGHFDYV